MLTALCPCPAEVYLGKWHGCDAAVKCLNPGLFFGGGDLQNHSAVADLVKEADILGRCRSCQRLPRHDSVLLQCLPLAFFFFCLFPP